MPTVCSLPLEITVLILQSYMHDAQEAWIQHLIDEQGRRPRYSYWDQHQPKAPSPPPFTMFRLARVCRLWRDVLATHTGFSSHVDFDQESVAGRMLAGADSHSLTVTYQVPAEDWDGRGSLKVNGRTDQFRKLLTERVSRLQTLLIPYLPELFTPEFAAQAISLRRLIFTGVTPAPAEDAYFPESLGPGAFPALTHLECNLPMWEPLTPLCVPSLRTLIIRRAFVPDVINGADEDDEAYLTDLNDLMGALSHTPRLEHLDVELADVLWDGQKVALPKLQVLKIRALTSVCAAFLRLATLPRDVKVQLECFYDPAFDTASNTAVLELLTETLAATAPSTTRFAPMLTASLVHTNAYGGYKLRGWRRALDLKAAAKDPEPDVELLLEAGADRADICTLLGVLPLHAVESVRLGSLIWAHGPPVFECARALCTKPALQRLALERVYASVAWEMLALTPATHVFFHEVTFETKETLRGDRTRTEKAEKMWNRLFQFTDHVSEFAAVCAQRTVRGLGPFVEMRHNRENPRPPAPAWGTQEYKDWLRNPHSSRFTEEPWTTECTP